MKRLAIIVVTLVVSLTLSGCSTLGFPGLQNVPLPGGAQLGANPYRVKLRFDSVLNLVPQAAVKVNDVGVGKVTDITLSEDNSAAVVTVLVNGDVELPSNAVARLRQSSLLGAKFVALSAPQSEKPRGRLSSGDVIPLTRTGRNPEVEEVLGALSLLLNGGGIEQMRTIVKELNRAMDGNEEEIKSFLANAETLVATLDQQKEEITRAIDSLNRLAATLSAQTDHIENALENLAPGIKVINNQRDNLVTMLQSLEKLSGVAIETVNKSQANLVANLKALAPILRKLAETGEALPKALTYLATYPFPKYAMKPLKGDFVNTEVKFKLDLSNLIEGIIDQTGPPQMPVWLDERKQQQSKNNGGSTSLLPLPLRPSDPDNGNQSGDSSGLLGGLLGGL